MSLSRPGRDLLLVTAASMLTGGYAIMLLTVTLMYGNDSGLSPVAAGALSSVFAFASLGCRPFSGLVCDRLPVKALFCWSMAGFALSPLAFLAGAPYGLLMAVRVFQGLCMGIGTTAAGTIATAIIPRERFTQGIGQYGIGMAASSAVAPGIGLWLLARWGYPGAFIVCSLAGAAALALILPVPCPRQIGPAPRQGSLWDGLYERTALPGALCTLALAIVQVTVMQLLSYSCAQRGYEGTAHFYAISTLAVIGVRLGGGRLSRLASDRALLIWGTAALGAAYAGLELLVPSALVLDLLALVYGAGHSMSGMILNSMAVAKAPPERLGAANATYLAASDLGYALGPLLWSAWADALGYRDIFLVPALTAVMLFIIFVIRGRKS